MLESQANSLTYTSLYVLHNKTITTQAATMEPGIKEYIFLKIARYFCQELVNTKPGNAGLAFIKRTHDSRRMLILLCVC